MRHSIIKSLIAATTIALAGGTAAQAGTVRQMAASVNSAAVHHYDEILFYSSGATTPLTVRDLGVYDVGTGLSVPQQVMNCGTAVKQSDAYFIHVLQPGQFCWTRAYPPGNGDGVIGSNILSDTTADATNINTNVRTSIEVRDASENTLTHAELH